MKDPIGTKLIIYSALFMTGAMSLPRLLAKGELLNNLVPFNMDEWLIGVIVSFLFCIAVFLVNKRSLHRFNAPYRLAGLGKMILFNLAVLLVFTALGGGISRLFVHSRYFLLNGYLLRFLFMQLLLLIELKVLATLYNAGQKERENEQLRHANTIMELELLKAQLNPHFFFNALGSLSAVVREDPARAQQYIAHLSKIFRYSLHRPRHSLVPLKEELDELHAYSELMKMRHENGFTIQVAVDTTYHSRQLPHMSLQPLIENALKHNVVSGKEPLTVFVRIEEGWLVVANNLRPGSFPEAGAGIGLGNLNERYRILLGKEIGITRTQQEFIVKLPLQ